MPAPSVSSKPHSPTKVPGNAFIFDADSYWVIDSKLLFDPDGKQRNSSYLGYFFLALGVILLLGGVFSGPFEAGFWFLLIGFGYFAGLGLYLIYSYFIQIWFNKTGKIAVGELISIEGTKKPRRKGGYSTYFEVTGSYSFYGPGHQTQIVGTTTITRDDLRDQELPSPGTPVVVLYINPKKYMAC